MGCEQLVGEAGAKPPRLAEASPADMAVDTQNQRLELVATLERQAEESSRLIARIKAWSRRSSVSATRAGGSRRR